MLCYDAGVRKVFSPTNYMYDVIPVCCLKEFLGWGEGFLTFRDSLHFVSKKDFTGQPNYWFLNNSLCASQGSFGPGWRRWMEAQDEGRVICQAGRFMKGVYKYRIADWSMSFFSLNR